MTKVPNPLAPYRITLETALIAAGRPNEADRSYRCPCGQITEAAGFIDVRDQPENFGGQGFVCQTCASDLLRREAAAHEEECRQVRLDAGLLDDEALNTLRAERNFALARSDWTQLADNRERIGADQAAAWDAHRQAWRDWFSTARETGVIGDLPIAPG